MYHRYCGFSWMWGINLLISHPYISFFSFMYFWFDYVTYGTVQQEETKKINSSLFALKSVIEALSNREKFVPYLIFVPPPLHVRKSNCFPLLGFFDYNNISK